MRAGPVEDVRPAQQLRDSLTGTGRDRRRAVAGQVHARLAGGPEIGQRAVGMVGEGVAELAGQQHDVAGRQPQRVGAGAQQPAGAAQHDMEPSAAARATSSVTSWVMPPARWQR